MIVLVESTTDETTATVVIPRTLNDIIGLAMRFETGLILQFYYRIVVIRKHIFHL